MKSNPPISQLSRPCNESMSIWSMFPCNIYTHKAKRKLSLH